MIKGYSAEQIRAAEAPHLAAGESLMQRAAAGLATEIRRALIRRQPVKRGDAGDRILLLVGSGNNGADTLYAGAELAAEGVDVFIVVTGNRVHEQALAAALDAGAHRNVPREETDAAAIAHLAASVDLVVDGILGTGTSTNPALRGSARDIVAAIMPVVTGAEYPLVTPVVTTHERPLVIPTISGRVRPLVIAVDIPSGINPNDGSVPDPLVLPVDVTVTFGGYKAGLLLAPASDLAGRVQLIDIGLGPDLEKLEPLIRLPE